MTADLTRPVTLMAIGDVHLGRRPAHLPEGGSAADLGPAAALTRAVDEAIARGVDAVLFAGDVVESSNARFEALRPLERQVGRLVAAGIPVIAVAGNHDVEALPRLADLVDGVTLLGRGGRWESHPIGDEQRGFVEVLGWSFPESRVRESPLRALRADPPPALPGALARIGLVHADLDVGDSIYAPVRSEELTRAGLDAWLLGHIHAPSLAATTTGGWLGYLGSLVGLDPTETGAHGPWLVQVGADGRFHAEQLPLAPLWWERRALEVGPDQDVEQVADLVAGLALWVAEEIQARPGSRPLALGLRVVLQGPTRHFQDLMAWVQGGAWAQLERQVGGTQVFVDQVIGGLRVAHDLEELAAGDDPPGLLARELRDLAEDGEAARELLAEARAALQEVTEDPRWFAPGDGGRTALPEAQLRELLQRAGMSALDALLLQRDGGREAEA